MLPALVADGGRLLVVDLRDLRNPVMLSCLSLGFMIPAIGLNGSLAYVFPQYSAPRAVDLSDLTFPSSYSGVFSKTTGRGVAVSGSLAYVYGEGVEAFDLTPGRPARYGCSTNGSAMDVAAQGDLAYVANGANGLAVLRHAQGPYLAITGTEGDPVVGKPIKLRWTSENLTGMLKLELSWVDWDGPAAWTLSNIPVSQGAAGYDVTIPANYIYHTTNYLRLISADGQTTAAIALEVLDSPPGPDTTKPWVCLATAYGLQAHRSEVCLDVTAGDASGIAQVELCLDKGNWAAMSMYKEGYWRKVLNLGAGMHNVTVRARDKVGLYSESIMATLDPLGSDRIPPVIEVGQPQDLAVLTGDCMLTLSGTASDPGTTSTGVTSVQMERNGEAPWQTLTGTASWSGQVRLAHGVNTFAFRCLDGNTASPGKNYSPVKTLSVLYAPPLTTPTLTIASPANRQILATRTVRVSGTAAGGGANLDKVEVRVNGGAWALTSGTAAWSLDCTLLPGFNTIEARATDRYDYVSRPVSVTVICQPATGIMAPKGSIGGLSNAIALKGSTVLMSEGTRVLVLDASKEYSVVKLAAMELGEAICDLAVDGNMVYVAAGCAGFHAYDLTDPAHPQWRGGYRESQWGDPTVAVAAAGGYAYVHTQFSSLLVFDVSSPEGPRLLREIRPTYGSTNGPFHLVAAGSRLLYGQGGHPLQAYDLRDPANPALAFSCGASAGAFAVSGNTAILVNGAVLTSYDLGAPGTARSSLTLAETIVNVQYSGTRLLALLASGALDVIDASNPARLKRLGTVTVLDSPVGYALAASPTRAYAATASGLRIYDSAPGGQWVGSYVTLGMVRDVATAGQVAWVLGSGRLGAVDVSNPDDPALLSTIAISNLNANGHLRLSGNRAFVPLINGSKQDYAVVDATNPARPLPTSGRVSPAGSRSAYDLAAYGNMAYAGTSGYLEVYDCANIANPVRVTSVTLTRNPYSGMSPSNIVVERVGPMLMAAHDQGLEFFDLTDPRRPEPAAMYYGPLGYRYGLDLGYMAVDGRTAALTIYNSAPLLLDCPNPWMIRELPGAPAWLSSYLYPALSGPWLALFRPGSGSPGDLSLCKISSSGALTLVDNCPSVPSMKRMVFAGKTLCLASGDTGLRLVRMNFPNAVAGWGAYE